MPEKRHQVHLSKEAKSRLLHLRAELFDLDLEASEQQIVDSLVLTAAASDVANNLKPTGQERTN